MTNLDISIIIPVYNTERYIADTIRSIENQKGVNFELILVDDGSKDRSLDICNYMKSQYDNIVCMHQENQGAPTARNRGYQVSKGNYIIFFDSDDLMVEGYLRKVKNLIDSEEPDLIISNYSTITDKGELIKKNVIKTVTDEVNFDLYIAPPYPCCKVYKSQIIKENDLFFDDVKIGQDLNFYLKYISNVNSVAALKESSTLYRILNNSISSMKDARILDIIRSVQLIIDYYNENHVDSKLLNNVYIAGLSNIVYQYNKLENLPYSDVVSDIESGFKQAFSLFSHKVKISTFKQLMTYGKIYVKYYKTLLKIKLKK